MAIPVAVVAEHRAEVKLESGLPAYALWTVRAGVFVCHERELGVPGHQDVLKL
jgi:hypothetical protein